jgi:PrpF protein
MPQKTLPAVFMRGGTSKAIIFHARDLPASREQWEPIFLSAIGSPDPNMRQLNGMGGGVSSLSKVCVIGPPTHPDADGEEGEAANRVNPEIEGRDFARGDGKSADEGRSKHVDHVTAV